MGEEKTTGRTLQQQSQGRGGLDRLMADLLQRADVRVNGDRPWDIQLHNSNVPERAFAYGNLGLGEAYMDGDWDVQQLDEFFFRVLRARIQDQVQPLRLIFHSLRARLLNLQSLRRARQVGETHYDLGNDFYREWLDPSMTYSAALFGEETQPDPERVPLEEAQARKYDRLLERIGMGPGERLLEIGCGWGGLALRAARRGTRVTGLSLSREQLDWAEEQAVLAGLDERIGFCYRDYRDETGTYDGVASVEMFEAVGEQYWPEYFRTLADRLRPGGRAGLQVITIEDEAYEAYRRHPDFIQLYVFPGGMLPTPAHLHGLAERVGLRLREMTPFGLHYAETLRLWQERFNAREQRIRELGYGESFLRLWRYYLSYCEAGFRMGRIDLMQVVLEKPGRAA